MCQQAGILEKKTNHSLRASGASALFNAGVPEKLIRDVTGHRSNALLLYERQNIEQKQAVSRVLIQGTKENNPPTLPAIPASSFPAIPALPPAVPASIPAVPASFQLFLLLFQLFLLLFQLSLLLFQLFLLLFQLFLLNFQQLYMA